MTRADLKSYLAYHAKQIAAQPSEGVMLAYPVDGQDAFLDQCINLGMGDFWGARRWPFRRRSFTIPITASANPYTLPPDFAAVSSLIDATSGRGRELISMDKEEFDKSFPIPSYWTVGAETYYAVGLEQGDNNWKVWFAPIPAIGNVIKLSYLTETPADPGIIPMRYCSGLIAGCIKFLFRIGSKERHEAWLAAEAEYNRLETIPTFDAGLPDTAGTSVMTPYPDWSPFTL